ncbi:hypothetical protein [Sphingomonas sp. IW22]|uniref:hypothetical protein n=1 Tax=Sphingomonas sp. IW22 TaxID=3242489 RepID=UPI003522B2A3
MSRPLVLILSTDQADRVKMALELVSAHAALGALTHLHFDMGAIRCVAAHRSTIREAQSLGVSVSMCPTGLADHDIDPALIEGAESYGLVALLSSIDDAARLIVI